MKKRYSKPDIAYEGFSLCTSLAACDFQMNHAKENQCGLIWADSTVFLAGIQGCTKSVIEGDAFYDGFCYHTHENTKDIFSS